ncbi:ABC transporter permease [Holzapfeliella sp. He02]|uniref:ABC transporter permease n=1 Tax=Holzapfeliella saturejae TaxID=3082953 RepID=A0ABU8SG91_9LACO
MHNSKLINPYTKIAVKTLMTKSMIIMGLFFMILIGIGIGIYGHLSHFNISDTLTTNRPAPTLTLGTVKLIFMFIVFILFSVLSGTMQSIVAEKDNNVISQIIPLITEKEYVLGKVFSAFALALISLVNLILCLTSSLLTLDLLNGQGVHLFTYLSKITNSTPASSLAPLILSLVIEVMTLILFTILVSGRINKVQESTTNALIVLLPLFITLFILIVPMATNQLNLISSLGMFVPLFSPLFLLINYSLNGVTMPLLASLFISIIYIIILYKLTIKLYQYFLTTNKKFSFKESIILAFNK